jgi:hypothetical protein
VKILKIVISLRFGRQGGIDLDRLLGEPRSLSSLTTGLKQREEAQQQTTRPRRTLQSYEPPSFVFKLDDAMARMGLIADKVRPSACHRSPDGLVISHLCHRLA